MSVAAAPAREPVIVGEGAWRFRWHSDWLRLPDEVVPGHTHGFVRSRDGRCFLLNQSRWAMIVLGADGGFLGHWGSELARGAHGLAIATEADGTGGEREVLWLTDYESACVSKRTLDGRELLRLPVPRLGDLYAKPEEYRPTEVAVAPDGTVLVADGYGKPWVHRFAADGAYLSSFGGPSGRSWSRCKAWEDPGRLDQPHGLRVIGDEVVVADRRHNRLQCFSLAGEHRRFVHGVRYPCTVFAAGDAWLIPDLYGCVHVLSRDGARLATLGDSPNVWDEPGWPNLPPERWRDGRFIAPHAVWAEPDGDAWVVEWTERGRVTWLERVRA